MLKVGDRAPEITAPTADGQTFTLSSLRGRCVVLYFYPKAFTPGCTTETRGFRDNYDDLLALGAEVVGVSVDDVRTQCRFSDEHKLRFPLLADVNREVSRSYDVLWPLLARDKRVTYVIDEQGVVQAVFRHEFQVLKHLDEVINFLKKHRAGQGLGSLETVKV